MRKVLVVASIVPVLAAGVMAGPAQAESVVKKAKLEKNIERNLQKSLKMKVTAKCPKKTTWVKGKVFTCKVTAADGTKGTVQVTLLSNDVKGRLKWEVLQNQ